MTNTAFPLKRERGKGNVREFGAPAQNITDVSWHISGQQTSLLSHFTEKNMN